MHLTRHLGHLPVPAGPDLVPQPSQASAPRRSPDGCFKRRRDPLFAGRRDLARARADGGVGSPDDVLDKAGLQFGTIDLA